MSLDLLKERFGESVSTNKKEVDKEKLNEMFGASVPTTKKEADKEKLNEIKTILAANDINSVISIEQKIESKSM